MHSVNVADNWDSPYSSFNQPGECIQPSSHYKHFGAQAAKEAIEGGASVDQVVAAAAAAVHAASGGGGEGEAVVGRSRKRAEEECAAEIAEAYLLFKDTMPAKGPCLVSIKDA